KMTAELENEIKLFKEYLEGKKSDQPLTTWNGIQLLSLMQKILDEIKKVDDMLDRHIDATNAY
ncbi:MAG: hypothetical protein CV087_22965, partial [Candidatus Brocadia sp. WS118]